MVITILDAPLPTTVYTHVSKHESLDSSGPASGTKKKDETFKKCVSLSLLLKIMLLLRAA